MLDLNREGPQILERIPLLTGVFLDPVVGPVTTTRPVAVLKQSGADKTRDIDESVTEDIYPQSELDAHHAQLGWPSLSELPVKPWGINNPNFGTQPTLGKTVWASRRFMVQRVTINLSPEDLQPVEPFVEAVEAALDEETHVLQIQALQKVFSTWGEMIPLNMVAGAYLAATGLLHGETTLPIMDSHPNTNSRRPPYDLVDIIDQHLGTSRGFARRLESRAQGGSSDALLNEGYGAWLRSVAGNPANWTVIKVLHAVPVTDILSIKLQKRIKQLFAGSLMYRSPSVGAPHGFSFEGAPNGLRDIESITIWFSDSRVRDISVKYVGGVVTGLYGYRIKKPNSALDTINVTAGEYITDLFVWHHVDGWIAGLQFVKSTHECSPIYGIQDRESIKTHPPALLSGNGNMLAGISGTYNTDYICQVKAVWQNDITMNQHRHTQTSFVGGPNGIVFNDLQYLADPLTSRIAQITAQTKDSVASFQVTYEFIIGGAVVRSETPVCGDHTGPLMMIKFEEGEHITGVRSHHNNKGLQGMQLITNKKTHPAFGAGTGEVEFSIDAPKTRDGRQMILHYISGKSRGWLDAVLFVWVEMPLNP